MNAMKTPEEIREDFVRTTENFYYYSVLSEWHKTDGDAVLSGLLIDFASIELYKLRKLVKEFSYLSMSRAEAHDILDAMIAKAREDYKAFTA